MPLVRFVDMNTLEVSTSLSFVLRLITRLAESKKLTEDCFGRNYFLSILSDNILFK